MKKLIVLLCLVCAAVGTHAQGQKAWDKEFEKLDVPADIKEHTLIIATDFSKKHMKLIEEIMQDYKGKWNVQKDRNIDYTQGKYIATLSARGSIPYDYYIHFRAAKDNSGGTYTKLSSKNWKNVMRHFVTWLNNL